MSSAANHRKRSHRSHFRTRAWNGGRKSVIKKPSIRKTGFMGLIKYVSAFFKQKFSGMKEEY